MFSFLRTRGRKSRDGPDEELVAQIRSEIYEAYREIDDEIERAAMHAAKKAGAGAAPGIEKIHVGAELGAEGKKEMEMEEAASDSRRLDILGYSNNGAEAYGIYSKDRVHIALFGETGSGKTVTIGQLVYQNIARGEGFMIIDPHGDLAREALAAVPEHLKDRIIYISAMNPEWFGRQIKVNPLECKDPKDRHIVAMTFVNALKNMYYKSWGDRLEAILRNCANALAETEGATLWDLSRLISSAKYRSRVIRAISSPSTINFLQNILPSYSREAGTAAYNKMDKILTTPLVAALFDTQKSSFDMGQAMNDGMFVIADLSSGMSDDIADFIGSILLNSVYVEAMRRVDIEREDRRPFYLYVDEAHRFSPAELQSLLTTVRKFNVKVTLASQTINNFQSDVQRSFGALCKTIILFKSDVATARMFETLVPVTADELASLSPNTFAFYSQGMPPVAGMAATKMVLARMARADWKARAHRSVTRLGSDVNLDKYMPPKRRGHVPGFTPLDVKIVYLLRSRKMTKEEIYGELVARYGDSDVDSESISKSVETLRLDHVVNRKYESHESLYDREFLELDYSAYHRFFNTRMIGARTGKERHRAAIIYIAETMWNSLTYCRIDLGDIREQLADIVVISESQWTDPEGRKRYDLQTWGEATAIEVETDPVHRKEQVVINYKKNVEQGFAVHYIVFGQSDRDAVARFLAEKGVAEDAYQVTVMDAAQIERFRHEKMGGVAGRAESTAIATATATATATTATISGAGGITPEEMRVIQAMRGEGESAGSGAAQVQAGEAAAGSHGPGEEIPDRIRAAASHGELAQIVREVRPDMPGLDRIRGALESRGYRLLLWSKKGHYLPVK